MRERVIYAGDLDWFVRQVTEHTGESVTKVPVAPLGGVKVFEDTSMLPTAWRWGWFPEDTTTA